LSSSDGFLLFLCWGGGFLSLLLFARVAPIVVLPLLWAFYLSLTTIGQVFLGYQWDALLLETGLLAILLAPLGLRPRWDAEPAAPASAVWLLRWLLFRLMFGSGVVKLRSGDQAWRTLTALRVHYETQPLPTWVGWYAHQLPGWFQTFSTAVMFAVELGAPFLIFAGRRGRRIACAAFVGLQLLIAATGNYCFFNLLTIALCLLLLDDDALPPKWRPSPSTSTLAGSEGPRPASARWLRGLLATAGVVSFALSLVIVADTVGLPVPWPRAVLSAFDAVSPFRSVNSYGLFAVMTMSRPEIIVEGSADGEIWRPYVFRWKPGDVTRRPAFVAPYQPRLDWQMWFAALGTCESNAWFVRFVDRLLEGSPPVVGLLAENPFPAEPPQMIRATLYDYRFTRIGEAEARSAWWRRKELGPYCPVMDSP
jgi:lipase maturation factor 1